MKYNLGYFFAIMLIIFTTIYSKKEKSNKNNKQINKTIQDYYKNKEIVKIIQEYRKEDFIKYGYSLDPRLI